MPLIETLVIEVGTSIAKSILQLWLKDSNIASDALSSIVDIVKARTTDRIAQQQAELQFRAIGAKVGASLLPIFEIEDSNLNEESSTAVALAVAETLNTVSSEILAEHELEPSKLAKHLLHIHPARLYHFNETEQILYQRIISESCEYIVDIASQLPAFTEHTFAEVLKRESQLLGITEQILSEVRRMREQANPMAEAAHFELEYRRAVVRNLDTLQLFGTDVAITSRRHRLSVAYVTLSVKQKVLNTIGDTSSTDIADSPDREERNIVSVDKALANSNRLLIRGLAGSGKTTLLQWIAVNSASQSFTGRLSDWNNKLPFYIRLRHCIQSGLPAPETFPKLITTTIADTMPRGWVHKELGSGHGIVLVDGLDEVPEAQREDVHAWLKDLMETYSKTSFIVTSRPHAVEEGWMDHEGFKDAELQPMNLSDIHIFIDHWYAAVAEVLSDAEEKAELPSFAQHLKEEIQRNRSKRNLATSPLLCALLCALNRERRQQLPSDRIELYESCCQMLIERRDKERRIPLTDYPATALTYRQKRVLLEDLAYWLIKNGWSAVSKQQADERFMRKLTQIPSIQQNILGIDVLRLFIERSSFIREPIGGYIDFTHRTFQEFLAAQAILDEGDIGVLVQNAHDDQWREVIILAAGLATRKVREELIQELINRGDRAIETKYRYLVHLVAVSCLETSVELSQNVKTEVDKRLEALVPPKDEAEVKALAAAGELAVPYLVRKQQYSTSITTLCINTLALIGGEFALDALEEYSYDTRPEVADVLWTSWDYFDTLVYARRILSRISFFPQLKKFTSLDGFQYLTNLTVLKLPRCQQVSDLSPLSSLTQLTSLDLSHCRQISDLSPLSSLTQLTSLSLAGCGQISDLSPLSSLTQLTSLNLVGCQRISDLSPLSSLTQLTSLNLAGCVQISDLSSLAYLIGLSSVSLAHCQHIIDLSSLAGLHGLISLNLAACEQISELHSLAKLTQLTSLDLAGCWRIRNLTPLTNLTQLTSLNLSGCIRIDDLSPLTSLFQLTSLDLSECEQINDLSPLSGLKCLKRLLLYGTSHQGVSQMPIKKQG